jgi:hypothetical protein
MVLFGTVYCNRNLFWVVNAAVKNYINEDLTRKISPDFFS